MNNLVIYGVNLGQTGSKVELDITADSDSLTWVPIPSAPTKTSKYVEFFCYSSMTTITFPDSGEEFHPPMLWIIKISAVISLMSE
jgi:hypothetical protein